MRILVGVVMLTTALASPAIAGPDEDALQVVEKWAAAFRASDVDAIVALSCTFTDPRFPAAAISRPAVRRL